MDPPLFLTLDQVIRLHHDLIDRYGGRAGIRDLGLLESAIAQPRSSFSGEFLHQDLYEMAAAYLYHIVQNHPFLDGNKRTGAAAAIIFLAINEIAVANDEEGLVTVTVSVASGHVSKDSIAEFLSTRAT